MRPEAARRQRIAEAQRRLREHHFGCGRLELQARTLGDRRRGGDPRGRGLARVARRSASLCGAACRRSRRCRRRRLRLTALWLRRWLWRRGLAGLWRRGGRCNCNLLTRRGRWRGRHGRRRANRLSACQIDRRRIDECDELARERVRAAELYRHRHDGLRRSTRASRSRMRRSLGSPPGSIATRTAVDGTRNSPDSTSAVTAPLVEALARIQSHREVQALTDVVALFMRPKTRRHGLRRLERKKRSDDEGGYESVHAGSALQGRGHSGVAFVPHAERTPDAGHLRQVRTALPGWASATMRNRER